MVVETTFHTIYRGFRETGAMIAEAASQSASDDLTFFAVSDTRYGQSSGGDETVPLLVKKMNLPQGTPYPEKLDGGIVGVPLGVLHNSDIANNGKNEHWKVFLRDYGLIGKERQLTYPVYEAFGNHDGGPYSVVRDGIKERNQDRIGLKDISENSRYYSWDCDGVHFVELNLHPANKQHNSAKYSPIWHDPQWSLSFLKKVLADKMGDSGQLVVLMDHCGFDINWWVAEDRKALYDAANNPFSIAKNGLESHFSLVR
jgi:hypothetical protein